MLHHTPLQILKKRWKFLFIIGILVALVAGGLTLLFPLSYRADAQVLIISKTRTGVDPYTVVRAAERVGENIVQVMKTNDFYGKVKDQANSQVDWKFFEQKNEREKRKLWQKTVVPSVVYGTGVLNVSAYHPDAMQSAYLANAAVNALAQKGWEYVGGDVEIKVVNSPVVTKWPVRPSVPMNAVLGFVVGILVGGLVVVKR
jgi:capsular polysaccharide biosynthesis protein